MNRHIFIAALIAAALFVGCVRRAAAPAAGHEPSIEHSHEGHSHDHADHADHDQSNEGHSHDHADHDDHAGHEGHSHAASPDTAPDDADAIVFTSEQASRTDFEVQSVVSGPFREVIRCYGAIEAARGERTTIVAPVGGVVTLDDTAILDAAMRILGEK